MSRIDRTRLIDDDSLLGGGGGRDADAEIGLTGSSSSQSDGALASLKSWWDDPQKRRWIIGGVVGVFVFLVIVAIAAVISREERKVPPEEAVTTSSSSSTGGAAPPPYNPETPWLFSRLPSSVLPVHYDVLEVIDLVSFVYSGDVNITVNITRAVDRIILHAVNMNCSNVALTLADSGLLRPAAVWSYAQAPNNVYLVLNFTDFVQPQTAVLSIAFNAALRPGGNGLFAFQYPNATGGRQWGTSTQFESVGARRAFPCFDEPALKATFSFTIVNRPQWPTVLSNMPGQTVTRPDGWLQTAFARTPVMSTYLLAFSTTDYDYSEAIANCSSAVTTRVFAPRHLKRWTVIPVQIAAAQMQHYCAYFNISYPLPKEDHIAINQNGGGAMENWGLITYGWNALLLNPDTYTVQQLTSVAVVVAHELAHQWFGNIVTASWWSHLWLNEGFATFVEYIGADFSNPELLMSDQFIYLDQDRAMSYDSTPRALPVVDEGTQTGNFGDSVYAKGGSMLRMIEGFLGPDVFLDGIRRYLQRYKYRNANSNDLFDELSAASLRVGTPVNVSRYMATWIQQPGYPLLNCSTTPQADGSTVWLCTQHRFYASDVNNTASTMWWIYVTVSTDGAVNQPDWWPDGVHFFSFIAPAGTSYLKLNSNSTGYYRVLYDHRALTQLSDALNRPGFSGLTHDDRLGLVLDARVFRNRGYMSVDEYYNLTRFLRHEESWIVWMGGAAQQLQSDYRLIAFHRTNDSSDARTRDLYTEYLKLSMRQVAASLNFSAQKSVREQMLQVAVTDAIVRFDAGDRRRELSRIFAGLMNGTDIRSVPSNLLDPVLRAGVVEYGESAVRWLAAVYQQLRMRNSTVVDKDDPLAALSFQQLLIAAAEAQQVDALQLVLDCAIGQQYGVDCLRREDRVTAIGLIANNPLGLQFVNSRITQQDNFDFLNATMTDQQLSQLITAIISSNNVREDVDALRDFFSLQTLTVTAQRAVDDGLRAARNSVQVVDNLYPVLRQYLESGVWKENRD